MQNFESLAHKLDLPSPSSPLGDRISHFLFVLLFLSFYIQEKKPGSRSNNWVIHQLLLPPPPLGYHES